MEAGTSTVTVEDKASRKQNQAAEKQTGPERHEAGKDAAKRICGGRDGGKSKERKLVPAPERKKPAKLSEDKRFKLFSGTANPRLAQAIGAAYRRKGRARPRCSVLPTAKFTFNCSRTCAA